MVYKFYLNKAGFSFLKLSFLLGRAVSDLLLEPPPSGRNAQHRWSCRQGGKQRLFPFSLYLVYSKECSCDVSEPACDGVTCPNQRQSFSMISSEILCWPPTSTLMVHPSPSCADEPLTQLCHSAHLHLHQLWPSDKHLSSGLPQWLSYHTSFLHQWFSTLGQFSIPSWLHLPGVICQCLETFLIVTNEGCVCVGMILTSSW